MLRHMSDDRHCFVETLRLDAGGVWAVRSASATVYYVDLDRGMLLRQPGVGSSTGPYDGCWIRLLSVAQVDETGMGETGVIRVGRRHKYDMDPGGLSPYRWWLQRAVTSIETVPASQRPAGRPVATNEDLAPYGHPRQGRPVSGT